MEYHKILGEPLLSTAALLSHMVSSFVLVEIGFIKISIVP